MVAIVSYQRIATPGKDDSVDRPTESRHAGRTVRYGLRYAPDVDMSTRLCGQSPSVGRQRELTDATAGNSETPDAFLVRG